MKICYLILAHKNPEQLNMLVKKLLCDENAIIYMHISIPQYYELINRIITHDRLHIISNPIKVDWGGDNILRAQLLLLKNSIVEKAYYYQFITGQDFPIRNDLCDYLYSYPNQVFMDANFS